MTRPPRPRRPLLVFPILLVFQACAGSGPEEGQLALPALAPPPPPGDLSLRAHPNRAASSAATGKTDGAEDGTVNLFNGNLALPVALGISYPVSDSLSYRIALSYSSAIWDVRDDGASGIAAGPAVLSEAGLGWQLGFGRLVPPQSASNKSSRWLYVSDDGLVHALYAGVHGAETDPADQAVTSCTVTGEVCGTDADCPAAPAGTCSVTGGVCSATQACPAGRCRYAADGIAQGPICSNVGGQCPLPTGGRCSTDGSKTCTAHDLASCPASAAGICSITLEPCTTTCPAAPGDCHFGGEECTAQAACSNRCSLSTGLACTGAAGCQTGQCRYGTNGGTTIPAGAEACALGGDCTRKRCDKNAAIDCTTGGDAVCPGVCSANLGRTCMNDVECKVAGSCRKGGAACTAWPSDTASCSQGTCAGTGVACSVDVSCGGTTGMTCGGEPGGQACSPQWGCTGNDGDPLIAQTAWRCANKPAKRCNAGAGGVNCEAGEGPCLPASGYCATSSANRSIGCDGNGNGGIKDCPGSVACIAGGAPAPKMCSDAQGNPYSWNLCESRSDCQGGSNVYCSAQGTAADWYGELECQGVCNIDSVCNGGANYGTCEGEQAPGSCDAAVACDGGSGSCIGNACEGGGAQSCQKATPSCVIPTSNPCDGVAQTCRYPANVCRAAASGYPRVAYTRDATYMRLTLLSATSARLELPSGLVEEHAVVDGVWRLVRRADRRGNDVRLAWSPALLQLTDVHGRVQKIYLKADPAALYASVIDKVEVAAFGNTRATYLFTYTTATIPRSCEDTSAATSADVTVPLLSTIQQPDGTKLSFRYAAAAGGCAVAGRLESMTLPAGGSLEWTYGSYPFQVPACTTPQLAYLAANVGIAARRRVGLDGTLKGAWSYATELRGGGSCAAERQTTVYTPLGHREVHSFTIDPFAPGDYGLPLARATGDGTGTRWLSRQVYACAAGCNPLRSTYVAFEQDGTCDPRTPSCANLNRRLSKTRVVYHDDPLAGGGFRSFDSASSDFDGLGHYRRLETTGVGQAQTITTRYNPQAGTYPGSFVTPRPAGPWLINAFDYELTQLGEWSARKDTCFDKASGELRRARARKDVAASGASDVITEWTVAGPVTVETHRGGDLQPVPVGEDLCALALPAPFYRIDHTYDRGALASSQYVDGVPVPFKSRDQDIDASTGLVSVSRDVAGVATGFQYDALGRQIKVLPAPGNGATTELTYSKADVVARTNAQVIKRRRASQDGAILTEETRVFNGFGQEILTRALLPGGISTEQRRTYNAMSWPLTISQPAAPGAAAIATTFEGYDPFGRPTAQTLAGVRTTYAYRGLGTRSTTVPVGVFHYSWSTDVVSLPETNTVDTDAGGRVIARIRDYHDSFGHPKTEKLEYAYDPSGNVTRTWKNGALVGYTHADGRGFVSSESRYLGQNVAGVLHQLIRPYLYDARGHAHRVNTLTGGEYPGKDRIYDYDAAERPTTVRELADPTKIIRELQYGTSNAAGDLRKGRLTRAIAYNLDVPFAPVVAAGPRVVDEFVYGGPNGLVSTHRMQVFDAFYMVREFVDSTTYDELGNVATQAYPACTTCYHPACDSCATRPNIGPGTKRTVTATSQAGEVVAVSATVEGRGSESWITSVGYAGDGRIARIDHGNGVHEFRDPDPTGVARLGRMRVEGYSTGAPYDSGAILYDGAGDLVAQGTNVLVPQFGTGENPDLPAPADDGAPCGTTGGLVPIRLDVGPEGLSCEPSEIHVRDAFDRVVMLSRTSAPATHWRLHGADGRLLREYTTNFDSTWATTRDLIYRGRDLAGTALDSATAPSTLLHAHGRAPSSDQNGVRK